MCPIPDVGDDLIVSSGCESTVLLDASNSSDPDDTDLNYSWSSIDGYTSSIDNANSYLSTFNFPNISSDQVFQFSVTVDDGENFISDTLFVTYLSNTAPLANAGDDFITCDASFVLSARKSYDVDWNSLSYSWSVLDGSLNNDGANTKELNVESHVDLDQDNDYSY